MRKYLAVLLAAAVTALTMANGFAQSDEPVQKPRRLYVVGVSHLDTQWRWTIQNTIDEYIPNTFRDNFKLMDLYPNYVFSFEGAFKYMLYKEYYPEEYKRLKPYIDRGQWRLAGCWVDPVDVNMPSMESLVRQALYGNGYFKEEFGKTSKDILLPDCFGFGYTLPSIGAHCGIKSFSTQKLSWGSSVGVPFDIGLWEGIDGSTLVSALNPGAYVTQIKADLSRDTLWRAKIDSQGARSGLYADYMYFGTGDVGGAPDSLSVDWLAKSEKSEGPLTVKNIGSDDLADLIPQDSTIHLPRYKGELLMTRHGVGCYSSQAAMKRWNRKNELLAEAAEKAAVLAVLNTDYKYPGEAFKENWIRFLWHQFHDDLTGTSIPEAYQFSWNDEILCQNRLGAILENASEAVSSALNTKVKGTPIVVYNPLAVEREDAVEATVVFDGPAPSAIQVFDPSGKETPSQILASYGDSLKILFLAKIPSAGYGVFDAIPAKGASKFKNTLNISNQVLGSERYVVSIDSTGDISDIYDNLLKQHLLSSPLRWQLLHDKPKQWPAWEIQYDDIIAAPVGYVGGKPEIRILEWGPVRASLEIIRHEGESEFKSVISLYSGGAADRIDIANEVDWYEKETLLKAAFKFNSYSDSVTYDLGLGTIKRGLNQPKLYEVPAQEWADMTSQDGRYGVTVMNDCKYGWDHPDSATLRLSLIHTPGVYDSWSWVGDQSSQDLGHHQFAYAIMAHGGDWRDGGAVEAAARFNQPLISFQPSSHAGALGREVSIVSVGHGKDKREKPSILVSAMKKSETGDALIIRVRELNGTGAEEISVQFIRPVIEAYEVNGLEEKIGPAEVLKGQLLVSLSAYQPKAYAVRLGGNSPQVKYAGEYASVVLPYNLDGVSYDDNRKDGDFDGQGHTLVGELLPDTVNYLGIPFVTGPKNAGAKNVLSSQGQKLEIPAGSYNRLYILAAAVGGPARGLFELTGANKKTVDSVWVPDYAEFLGQWNNRLVFGGLAENKGEIEPSYIIQTPVAWTGTHRHNDSANGAYQYTNMFCLELALPEGNATVQLPDNPRIKIMAATAGVERDAVFRPATALSDRANNSFARIKAERKSFIDSLMVQMDSPVPGGTIRYTLDSGEPTENSPLYAGPVTVKETTTLKARSFLPGTDDRHVTEVTFKKLAPRDPVTVKKPVPGLKCIYYEGEWQRLPNFDSLTAVKDTVWSTVAIPGFARPEDYALVFTGFVKVPTDGLYDFFIGSDDGSRLMVDDSAIADNDGIHGDGEVSCEVALKAGLHPIRVFMFQAKGGQALSLSYRGPGIKKQSVPPEAFFHPGK
ncbi:putative Alpha-mannosidase [Candidatus Zixiibacteriota bacterium]|nr:putative Alpha-mannosidase [candidate division Zixibacteria bacterium]